MARVFNILAVVHYYIYFVLYPVATAVPFRYRITAGDPFSEPGPDRRQVRRDERYSIEAIHIDALSSNSTLAAADNGEDNDDHHECDNEYASKSEHCLAKRQIPEVIEVGTLIAETLPAIEEVVEAGELAAAGGTAAGRSAAAGAAALEVEKAKGFWRGPLGANIFAAAIALSSFSTLLYNMSKAHLARKKAKKEAAKKKSLQQLHKICHGDKAHHDVVKAIDHQKELDEQKPSWWQEHEPGWMRNFGSALQRYWGKLKAKVTGEISDTTNVEKELHVKFNINNKAAYPSWGKFMGTAHKQLDKFCEVLQRNINNIV